MGDVKVKGVALLVMIHGFAFVNRYAIYGGADLEGQRNKKKFP